MNSLKQPVVWCWYCSTSNPPPVNIFFFFWQNSTFKQNHKARSTIKCMLRFLDTIRTSNLRRGKFNSIFWLRQAWRPLRSLPARQEVWKRKKCVRDWVGLVVLHNVCCVCRGGRSSLKPGVAGGRKKQSSLTRRQQPGKRGNRVWSDV